MRTAKIQIYTPDEKLPECAAIFMNSCVVLVRESGERSFLEAIYHPKTKLFTYDHEGTTIEAVAEWSYMPE